MPKFSEFNLASATEAVPDREVIELTFGELLDAFIAAHPCDSTGRLRKWRDAFGCGAAWSIERDMLARAAEAMLAAGYSPSSVNRDLSAIGSAFKWAAEVRKITPRGFRSPTRDLRRYKESMRVITMSVEQEQQLRDNALAFRDRRFGVLVALLLDSGARPGEVLERTWNEFDIEQQEIVLPEEVTKTGRARVLHFSASTARLIERVRPAASMRGERAFAGRAGSIKDYDKSWAALVASVGRPELHMYDLRHVAAARLLNSGVSAAVASQVLGNSSLVLHRRYGHLERSALKRAQRQAWQSGDSQITEAPTSFARESAI